MANSIDDSKRVIYAQEAFQALQSNLGLTKTVYTEFQNVAQNKGELITIDKPSVFSAGAVADGSDSNDLSTSKIQIQLSNWEGVKFAITDRDMQEVSPNFMQNHLFPAVAAVADAIETDLFSLYKSVPWYRQVQGTDNPAADMIAIRKILKDNKVPNDGVSYAALNTERYAALLGNSNVLAANASAFGGQPQADGVLPRFAGLNTWESQNIPTHTAGAITASAPKVKGAQTAGAVALTIDDTTLTGTVKAGDIFSIAGSTQQYTITADATASGNEIAVSIYPALVTSYADNAAVTFHQETTKTQISLAYHRSAIALAVRPLPQVPNSTVISDPRSGLSLRYMMWYDADNAKHWARVDALWGYAILDGNRAVRYESAP